MSDYPDMSSQAWTSQVSMPEEQWITGPFPSDHSTMMQPLSLDGYRQGLPITTQGLPSLDTSTSWMDESHYGAVDLGMSPDLSYESQSSHTLNPFSEPDEFVMPPASDLSSAPEPVWIPSAPLIQSGSLGIVSPMAEECFPQLPAAPGVYVQGDYNLTGQRYSLPRYPQTASLQYEAQPGHMRRTSLDPPSVSHRILLPRTEGFADASQPAYGAQRILRPSMSASRGSQSTMSSVSTSPGQQYGATATSYAQGQATSMFSVPREVLPRTQILAQPMGSTTRERVPVSNPAIHVTYAPDRTIEEFGPYVPCDQEEQYITSAPPSYLVGYGTGRWSLAGDSAGETDPDLMGPPQSGSTPSQSASAIMSSISSESEEPRYRNHPMYMRGPEADGRYHCPYFQKDPNCQHRPTKLKCNYDKFIDSHLKPFRCKVETCATQEFSSTACLLRHEREAHGMHGHGDRPHLCYYSGCERGVPGSGFPRRYNLFDHMKRVHDHQEDPTLSATGSPFPGVDPGQQGPTKAEGRKRKARSPPSAKPVVQRQRTSSASVFQSGQVMVSPLQRARSSVSQSMVDSYSVQAQQVSPRPRRNPHSQRSLYTQWATQRQLLARQMDFVQSPEDEANLDSLSQNIDELRRLSSRLSQEARRG